jgi:NADH-quinone oxidoreductase subunit N
MYFKDGPAQAIDVSPAFKVLMVVLAAVIIVLGIFPNLLTYWLYF